MAINEVILFEHRNFHGKHKHIFQDEPNLNADDDNGFNDITSSIIITGGVWQFFDKTDFKGLQSNPLGPGTYPIVQNDDVVGIRNDCISSVKLLRFT